jgi:heme-degrading monooxygenase HmoA
MDRQRVILVVGTNPPPGKEAEFNIWYDNVHIPMLLKAPGMVRATRYQLVGEEDENPEYLAIYELEDEAGMAKFAQSPEAAAAHKQRREQWAGGPDFSISWRANYQVLSEHEK